MPFIRLDLQTRGMACIERSEAMYRKLLFVCSLVLLMLLFSACGSTAATSQQELPTPTPLPPAPALERPTYTVERGTVERVLEINARVTPVDLVRLSFRTEGRVEAVNVERGDQVQAGDIIAQLQQDEALEELRQAENRLVQARRDLENAQQRRRLDIERQRRNLVQAQRSLEQARIDSAAQVDEAEITLQRAQEDLAALQPGGANDPLREARETVEDAQRELKTTRDNASEAKTQAENALIEATQAVEIAQDNYSDAYWDWDWVQRYGTDPNNEIEDPVTGESYHPELSDTEKEEFRRAFEQATRDLEAAERAIELAEREVELQREAEVYEIQEAEQNLQEAERELNLLAEGEGSEALTAAERNVQDARRSLEETRREGVIDQEEAVVEAQLALEEAQQETFLTEQTAIEDAQIELEKAQKRVNNGRIIAPQAGEILALSIGEGDQVEAFEAVVELADPAQLEIAAELSAEQMRQLAEGQPAEVTLLARPDVVMPAVVRRLPAPYGSGGSGAVAEEDQTTRFEILDTKGLDLTPGAVAKVRVVLEEKEDVLWLPPDAIRSFEGRQFVVIREGDRERRAPVEIGIRTDDRVEILEGVEAGDIIVGQ
ncbi:MAG: biotin/lipoyl-binding protein [Chloroflexaceae bacterium]